MPPQDLTETGNWCPIKCRGQSLTPHLAWWAAGCCVKRSATRSNVATNRSAHQKRADHKIKSMLHTAENPKVEQDPAKPHPARQDGASEARVYLGTDCCKHWRPTGTMRKAACTTTAESPTVTRGHNQAPERTTQICRRRACRGRVIKEVKNPQGKARGTFTQTGVQKMGPARRPGIFTGTAGQRPAPPSRSTPWTTNHKHGQVEEGEQGVHEEQVEDGAASHGFLDAGPGYGAPAQPRGLNSLSRGAFEPGRL